ncbi:hypothetical protein ABK040_003636 [Willaertia magna]
MSYKREIQFNPMSSTSSTGEYDHNRQEQFISSSQNVKQEPNVGLFSDDGVNILMQQLCQDMKVTITESIKTKARLLFQKCITMSQVLESSVNKQASLAFCSLLLASRLQNKEGERYADEQLIDHLDKFELQSDGVIPLHSLVHIKQNIPMNFSELFELLNNSMISLQFENTSCYTQLQLAQKKLILCDNLFNLYKQCYSEFISKNLSTELFKMGWVSFGIIAKHLPSSFFDFEETLHCLVSFILIFWTCLKEIRISNTIEEIYNLCYIKNVNEEIHQFTDNKIKEIFKVENFNDFLINPNSITLIHEIFDKQIDTLGSLGFDERVFLIRNDVDFIGDINRLTSSPVYQIGTVRGSSNDPLRSPLRSPRSLNNIISPLQATISTIQLLEDTLHIEQTTPNEELLRFLKACNIDQTLNIENRVQSLVEQVPVNHLFMSNAQKRKDYVIKTYYQVLRTMLQAEEKRLGGVANFTTLLTNENFHRSHIVCSIECIMFAYNCRDKCHFITLLDKFYLEPFELAIVIESFVQHATWLNSGLKRHFRSIEEKLLGQLVWRKGSILYSKLDTISVPQPPKPGNETPKRQIEAFGMYSPIAKRQQQPNVKGSYSVQFFFRKVYKLVSRRIQELCIEFNLTQQEKTSQNEPMNVSLELMEQVWHIVHYVLNEARFLMVNRHIDHIIMCSMYAICNKVNRMRLSFRDIIINYKHICENNGTISAVEVGKILWQVCLEKENEFGDIVKFYNSVYIPAVKNFILDRSSYARPEMPYVELYSKKVAPNFVLSPRKSMTPRNFMSPTHNQNEQFFNQMTPKTKALYSFGSCCTVKHYDNTTSPTTEAKRGVKRTLDFGEGDTQTTTTQNLDTKIVKL